MTDDAIIEAAERALLDTDDELGLLWDENDARQVVRAILAAVTPLIRAAALEEAAMVADEGGAGYVVARRIRALKEQP